MKLRDISRRMYIWLVIVLILSQMLIISGPAAGAVIAADSPGNSESDPLSPEELLPDFREEDAIIAGLPAPMATIIKKIEPQGVFDLPGVGMLSGFSEPVAQFSTIYAEQNSGGVFSAEIVLHIIFSRDTKRLADNLASAETLQANWRLNNIREDWEDENKSVKEVEFKYSGDTSGKETESPDRGRAIRNR